MNGYFAALHQRLTHLYAAPCSCPQCQSKPTQTATLNNKNQKRFKKILKAAEIAFKKLHQRQGYKPEDLAEVPEYLQLIQDTASLLSAPIADNVMPATMAQALKSDAFLFGGMKVHAQLFQAGTMLLHPDGSRKTYNQLRQELDTLNTTYNQHHLQAEYLFATTAAQSAARWAALETDTERYLLQYRTAGDSRVRDSHTALNRVTLPATHTFWSSYYPPNGWRCRCLAIEVRAKDHPATDSATAIADGEKATTQIGKNGKNSLEIFRFNPGKDKLLFPPKHPYYKTQDAANAKKTLAAMLKQETYKQTRDEARAWGKANLTAKGKIYKIGKPELPKIVYKNADIKTITGKPHKFITELCKEVKNLPAKLKSATYLGSSAETGKHNTINQWHYYEFDFNGEKSYFNVMQEKNGNYRIHSVSDEKGFDKNKIQKKV